MEKRLVESRVNAGRAVRLLRCLHGEILVAWAGVMLQAWGEEDTFVLCVVLRREH